LSNLIASLLAQKSKTKDKKTQPVLSKRKGPTVFADITNETLVPTPSVTDAQDVKDKYQDAYRRRAVAN